MEITAWFEEVIAGLPIREPAEGDEVGDSIQDVFPSGPSFGLGRVGTSDAARRGVSEGCIPPCGDQSSRSDNRSLGPDSDGTD